MSDRDQKVIFAFVPGDTDGVPVLTFLMPEAAWDYMRDGLAHEFDLTTVGIPVKVLIGRTKDHASGMAALAKANEGPLKDIRHVDVRFKQPKP